MTSFNLSVFIFILISIFTLSYLTINLSLFNKNQKLCIKTVTSLQAFHRQKLKKLLSLNSKAKLLRRERKSALRALKTAPHPAAKAAAAAWLAKVGLAQIALKNIQIGMLKIGDLKTQSIKVWLYKKNARLKTKVRSLKRTLNVYPRNSITPSYKLKRNFSNLKTIQVITYTKFFNQNLSNESKLKFQRTKKAFYKCKATIQKTGNKLQDIKLVADKQSLKYLAF